MKESFTHTGIIIIVCHLKDKQAIEVVAKVIQLIITFHNVQSSNKKPFYTDLNLHE